MGAFRSGLNWVDVKIVADLEHIKLTEPWLKRIRKAESLSVAQDVKRMSEDKG
jgi:hypothetical protein